MGRGFIAKAATTIEADTEQVWKALVDPEIIKQYLFGTEAVSDWKEGGTIVYRGSWQGKDYEDKGRILALVPGKLFRSTYWSSMSGRPDSPENYATVSWELSSLDGATMLSVTQDNNPDEESARHSESNWTMVLGTIKRLLEGEAKAE
jgi:uncharacterized protein YndB with AHSA1/START domain